MQVYGYCMFKDDEEAKVGYPTEGFDGDVAGRSFHNGRFVQRLREAAASVPSIALRQGIAKRLLNGEAGHSSSSGCRISPCQCVFWASTSELLGRP